MRKISFWVAGLLGIAAILLLFFAGTLYRVDVLELSTAFLLLRWGAYIGIAAMPLVIIIAIWQRPNQTPAQALLVVSFVAGLFSFYVPYSQLQTARSVPPIHDITTDISNPPAFVAIAPLRADAPNPVEYPGEETAEQQREAYPDIRTLQFEVEPYSVFGAAQQVVARSGWELVAAQEDGGSYRIEATATTRWFGFKDDVVIRIRDSGSGVTEVDIRSKSRVGRSDVGANADRIRTYSRNLQRQLGATH